MKFMVRSGLCLPLPPGHSYDVKATPPALRCYPKDVMEWNAPQNAQYEQTCESL